MGIINVLDISVANLIAAGEVVERPCNAVKELVENAIDAGATAVTVEIKRGGVSFLRVTDNGSGMSGEDAVTAIRRHATSKIKNASDLTAIGTLGFRGEALAAITAVSEYRIMTKRAADEEGTLVAGAYGKTSEVSPTGCPDGTTIICERLFATTPARLKFLKSDASEGSAVAQMLEKLAVSRPEIAFRFISDGNLKFSTAGDNVLKNAIYSVYGSAFASKLVSVQGGARGIRVEGYVSSPDFVRGNRGMQQFFINNRSVRSKTLTASLEAAFASYLAPSKYPSCVLNIEIPLSLVDVNIHPAKLEVKFSDEKSVFDALYSAVRGTLVSAVSRPVLEFTEQSLRAEGNLQNTANIPTGEQTKLDMLFREASQKGAVSEIPTSASEPLPKSTPKKAEKVEKDEKKSEKQEKITEIKENKETAVPIMTKAEPRVEKPSAPMEAPRLQKYDLLDDEDVSVDVPPIRENPMRRLGLGSNSDIGDFDAKARLYGAMIKTAPSAWREPVGPVLQTKTVEEEPEREVILPKDSTDAKIPGKTAKPIPEYRIVGEVFASYVIIEVEEKMILIDKHAAHERINFERLRANMTADVPNVQMLLAPDTIEMTGEELAICKEYRGELEKVGFEFEISEREVRLFGIPQEQTRTEARELFVTLVTETMETGEPISLGKRNIFEKALYQSACKSAVKAGRVYDMAHIRWICDNLLRYDCIKFCPHGRPVAFELSKKELDGRFGRT